MMAGKQRKESVSDDKSRYVLHIVPVRKTEKIRTEEE